MPDPARHSRYNALSTADGSAASTTSPILAVTEATGATKVNDHLVTASATLAARQPDAPHIAPGSLFGYIPLDAFGVTRGPAGRQHPRCAGRRADLQLKVKGLLAGSGTVRTDMTTPLVRGTTTDVDTITVTK